MSHHILKGKDILTGVNGKYEDTTVTAKCENDNKIAVPLL